MKKSIFINNKWTVGNGLLLSSLCPVTQTVLWQGKQADETQVSEAMQAATTAFNDWSMLSLETRLTYLKKYQSLLERDKEALALLIAKEVGKPFWEAKTEVAAMINKLNLSLSAFKKRTPVGHYQGGDSQTVLTHRAHGVFVILGPYNFPGHLPNGHIIPALLAGNTIVFKPSELTPMVAEAMMRLFQEAKLPAGVLNLVQGDASIGQALLETNPSGILFTGSYATGKKIHAHFSGRPEIILALEMGGNNPLIISKVKNMEAAVFNTIMSAFITSGQRCTCVRRLLVPNSVWGNAFLIELVRRTKALTVNAYDTKPEPFMGPVISTSVAKALMDKQRHWQSLGAESLLEMKSMKGALLTPGIIDVSKVSQQIDDEEIFGPLLKVLRYENFTSAIQIANNTRYGLSSGLISDDTQEQTLFYQAARAGIVNINKQLTGALGSAPFGGIGCSGNHRASAFYAADFCAYPIATMSNEHVEMLSSKPSGMNWEDPLCEGEDG